MRAGRARADEDLGHPHPEADDGHSEANSHRDGDAEAGHDHDADRHGDPDGDRNGQRHRDAHRDRHADSHRHPDSHRNADADRDPDASYPLPVPLVANLLGTDPVWHLARRATFGPTPDLVAEIRAKGTSAWLDEQLNPTAIDDSACDAYLTRYPSLPMTTMQIRAAYPAYSWNR